MYRIVVLYQEAPDPEGYADHVERFCQPPNGVFRHGPVTGAAVGDAHAYYAEFEFADKGARDEFARMVEFGMPPMQAGAEPWPSSVATAKDNGATRRLKRLSAAKLSS